MIRQLSAEDFERFIREHREKEFQIIDVRRHEEYRLDHIPGAVNIPIAEIQFDPYMFEDDKKLVFYCRSGRRSQVAAIFVAETGYPDGDLYNLRSGMADYTGEILLDYPRVDLLPPDNDPAQLMATSIGFEKGAFYFYSKAMKRFASGQLHDVMSEMVQSEVAHAKAIYNQMKTIQAPLEPFEAFFDNCSSHILEGGKSIEEADVLFENKDSVNCMDIFDFAIDLEYCAYDLYKSAARQMKSDAFKTMFLSLAQAEKKHLDKLIQSLDLCKINS